MKRLIGIAVIFTLVTASAFAQLRVNGQVRAGGELLQIDSGDDSAGDATKPRVGSTGPVARLEVSAGNDSEAGDWGGVLRLVGGGNNQDFGHRAFVWWRPHNMLRLSFGRNNDSFWGLGGMNGWGFLHNAQDVNVATNLRGVPNAGSRGFFAGLNQNSILASVYPIEGLTINIGMPLGAGPGDWLFVNNNAGEFRSRSTGPFTGGQALAEDAYKMLVAQIQYDINNIGVVSFTYQGGRFIVGGGRNTNMGGVGGERKIEAPAFWLSFNSNSRLVENLEINFGVGYEIPLEENDITYQDPMSIGLGVGYTMGDLNVRFRTAFTFIGSTEANGTTVNDDTEIAFELLPNYALGSMRVFLNLGLGMVIPDEGDTHIGWTLNPYIRIPAGGIEFFAGFAVQGQSRGAGIAGGSAPGTDQVVSFTIPLGIYWNF